MAQAEDTELRDLVIEALERNGSLAKIRALLRANIFLAFEDECENRKQNVNLDNILRLPEGILALSVIHEFLEFTCLKNTLFVYMSESRQGNEYNYDGKRLLADKLNISKSDAVKEPILLTLIKNMVYPHHKKSFDSTLKSHDKCGDKIYRDEENCTYILHDSQSSTTSNSNSDNSSDEKNKLHLRLQLDNSDTDTSSDSTRDKSSSEYIPGDHILETNNNNDINNFISQNNIDCVDAKSQTNLVAHEAPDKPDYMSALKKNFKLANSSSDSTSYAELKPFNSLDEKMLNTAGLPIVETDLKSPVSSKTHSVTNQQNELSPNTGTLSSISPVSLIKENTVESEKKVKESSKSEEGVDISYGDDFSSSPISKLKDVSKVKDNSVEIGQGDLETSPKKNSSIESAHQASQSSQSSVSLSDVGDLISEKSSLSNTHKSIQLATNNSKVESKSNKLYSDDSGDFTESPVPSLSNLSLDIHSD